MEINHVHLQHLVDVLIQSIYLFFKTEQSGVKVLAQWPSKGGLVLLGIEPRSYWYQGPSPPIA